MQNEATVDEVSWRRQYRYLTLVVDHRHRQVVWDPEGSGEKVADEFFADLDPTALPTPPKPETAEVQQQPLACGG